MAEKTKPGKWYDIFHKSGASKMDKSEGKIFEKPMILIDIKEGKPTCNDETLTELSKIEKTLNVVSVVGSLRTGKSFMLNKLAKVEQKEKGFETGHTTVPVTKGIWVLCRQHPTQDDQVLVLLDTEGIDDPDKVEIIDDQWFFILSTLLSSTMVYNTKGQFDKTTMDKFKFLRQIKTSVSVTGSKTDDSILDFFFPNFVLALRDFTSKIQEKTSDVFLEGKLMLQRGKTDSIREFNEPRQLIRRYFKKRRCFIFVQPVKTKNLEKLMTIPEKDLIQEFQKTFNSFRDYIFSREPKRLKSGKGVNGRMLATLLKSYVNSIRDGESPCLSEAMNTMTDFENARAVEEATEVYNIKMKKLITAQTVPKDEDLLGFHRESMKAAIEVLKTKLVFDDKQVYEEQALVTFKEHFSKFKATADKNSRLICENRLDILNLKVLRKVKNRVYCHPAGYDEYMKDIDWIIKRYNKDAPYLGTKARSVLQGYLDGKEPEEEQVYQMVLHAQEGTKEKIRPRTQRLSILTEVDPKQEAEQKEKKDAEEDQMDEEIKRDITALQINGMKSIGTQYVEILKMKVEELERVKSELSEDDQYYEFLLRETEYWKNLFEKATWNKPQYKNQIEDSSTSVLKTTEENCNAEGETLEKNLHTKKTTGENKGDLTEKKYYPQTYDEEYFKVIANPKPIDPIDPKFIVELDRKKNQSETCPIL